MMGICALVSTGVWGQGPSTPEIYGDLRQGEDLVSLDTRQSVTVKVVVLSPAAAPVGVFLLYPGGEGRMVAKDGRIVRASFGRSIGPMLAQRGFAVVAIDSPSDQPYAREDPGYDPQFRLSTRHLEDARAIVKFSSDRWNKPIYLLGHSNGTLSVSYLAASLGDERVRGIVLVASVVTRPGRGFPIVSDIPLDKVLAPVLIVHHRDDACAVTPFEAARRLPRLFSSSPRVAFLEVRGGKLIPRPASNACRGLWDAHNLYGKEAEAVSAIANWISGGPVPERIDP
jgi:predicted esterase